MYNKRLLTLVFFFFKRAVTIETIVHLVIIVNVQIFFRSAGFYRKAQLHDRAQVWDFGLYRLGNVLRIKDYPRFPLPNTGLFTRAVGLSHRPRRENGVRFIVSIEQLVLFE